MLVLKLNTLALWSYVIEKELDLTVSQIKAQLNLATALAEVESNSVRLWEASFDVEMKLTGLLRASKVKYPMLIASDIVNLVSVKEV